MRFPLTALVAFVSLEALFPSRRGSPVRAGAPSSAAQPHPRQTTPAPPGLRAAAPGQERAALLRGGPSYPRPRPAPGETASAAYRFRKTPASLHLEQIWKVPQGGS